MEPSSTHLHKTLLQLAREHGHELDKPSFDGLVCYVITCHTCGSTLVSWEESYVGRTVLLQCVRYHGSIHERCDEIPF